MSLLVVGSVALDSIETPLDKRERILGGSGSYFSSVAALLEPARLVGVVGEDFPEEHVDFLRGCGTDLEGLQRVSGKTFFWSGRYLENMVDRETLDTQLNVFQDFSPRLPQSFRDSELVFLANIEPRLQLQVLEQVAEPKLIACDTMNFWISPDHIDALKQVIARSHVLFVNDEEVRMLSGGERNLVAAAEVVRGLGADRLVVKRGDAGAMLFDDDGVFWAPAFPITEVVDPTGAGDCFAGGFMSYLAHVGETSGARIRQAMIVGTATASFAVEDFSVDRFRTLERSELVERCQAIEKLVHFERVTL